MHPSANYLIVLTTLCAVLTGHSLRTASADETKCSGTFNYGSIDKPVSCRYICPPNKTTDNNLRFCWVNCQEFMRCLLSLKPNGDEVIKTLQSSITADCPQTYFYYFTRHEYVPCRNVCVTTYSPFCAANCPGFSKCMTPLDTTTRSTMNDERLLALFVMYGVLCFVVVLVVVLLVVCYRRIHNKKEGQSTDKSTVRVGGTQPADDDYESISSSTRLKLVGSV